MKKILSILAIVAFANALFAQDDIILRTGDEIKAKVQEVGTSEIKYKRADNPNGPLYSIWKRELFMIKYENGTKEVFANQQQAAPGHDYRDQPEHMHGRKLPQDYKGMRHLANKRIAGGAVMIGVGAPLLIGGIALSANALNQVNSGPYPYDNGTNMGQFMTGALFTAGGVVLEVVGAITLKRGLRFRQMARDMKQPATIGFTPIQNPGLDRCERSLNKQTIGAVTLTF